jgi:uncharacterized membrane protein YccC
MPRLAAPLADAARSALRVDRSKIAFDVGGRAAVGVGACLVVGRLTGHTVAGVTATIGALSAGMASHQGTYRSRAGVVLAAAAAMGACAAVGALVGHVLVLDAVVTAAIAFFGALLVSLGPAGIVVGIQAVVGLVVFSQFDLPATVALRNGGLVLLGGAVQALLVVLLWPLRRFPAERKALSDAFATLAGYCRTVAADDSALLEAGALDGLQAVWRDSQPFGGDEIAAHRALAAQADRLRLELVAVARARARLEGTAPPAAKIALDGVLATSAAVLDEIAAAVSAGRAPTGWQEDRVRFRAARDELRSLSVMEGGGWEGAAATEAERRLDALAGQLRAVLRTAAVPAGVGSGSLDEVMAEGGVAPVPPRSGASWAHERLATLRSNLTLSSQACRHALRMSVAMAVAVAVSHAFSFQHRYWLPMTAMLVLRPDFASTVTRGLSRVAGTLVGAGLVTLALAELRPGPDWLIALVIVLCLLATALVLANYAVFSVCISSLVVTLLAFTGNPEVHTAADRTFYTLAGAVIAFAAYALWPTWERTSLPDTLAGLAVTEGRYAGAVLRAWADPAAADREALQRARLEARLARSNAEAAVTRWLAEPDGAGEPARETVLGYLAGVRSCVQAVLALHAELPAGGPAYPEAAQLAADVERAFAALSDQVKGVPLSTTFPLLRAEQLALAETLKGEAGGDGTATAAVVLAGETDLLVDSVDQLGHLHGLVG